MTEVFIKVDNLSLSIPIFLQRERAAKGWAGMFLGAAFDPPRRELVKILDDVTFDAREGDRIAILGRNGAGKSTLLRALNGVYAPTSGNVQVSGSVQALLNISLGFSSDATVSENIFLRGTAMGIKGTDLRDHIDPILEFSGLRSKSNHRLRTLSTGQKMRLGFAISTSFQHDIILMDEWVGTGDGDFMAKATERMQNRVEGSKIVMLASHSISLVREVCNKGIVLERGRLAYGGDILSALKYYHELLAKLRKIPEESVDLGEASGSAYGFVEEIRVEDGIVHVRGWSVTAAGEPLTGLVMVLGGARHSAEGVDRRRRSDVADYMGLHDDRCGFHARFRIPRARSLADLGQDVQLLIGDTALCANNPLHVADEVLAALQAGE
jgi:ABC-type polysaccharide/polyol phosphate transport system ATPase subunit